MIAPVSAPRPTRCACQAPWPLTARGHTYSILCHRCLDIGFVNAPVSPCPYPPGSPQKVAYMQARAAGELEIFSPEDHHDSD